MGFVYEVVPKEDEKFFESMGLKDCWENGELLFLPEHTKWCADRERNAYLVAIGGGYREMPEFYDLWWKGNVIRIEAVCGGKGNYETGVDIVWNVKRVPIPRNIWKHREEIMEMIEEAFGSSSGWCKKQFLQSITVMVKCEPEVVGDK